MYPKFRKSLSTHVAPLAVLAAALFASNRASAAPGDVFVASGNGNDVIQISADGSTAAPFGMDASLTSPIALAFDAAGYLYVSSPPDGSISRYSPSGEGSTFSIDPAIHKVLGMAFDKAGKNLYAANADIDNNILRIDLAGRVTVFFDGSTGATIKTPAALAFDSTGNLYVANAGLMNIVRITPAGVASTFVAAGVGGLGVPVGIAIDASDNVYVSSLSSTTGTGMILRYTQAGASSVFSTAVSGNASLAFDAAGNLFVGDGKDNTVSRLGPDGTGAVFGTNTGVDGIGAIAVEPTPTGTDLPNFFTGAVPLGNDEYYLGAGQMPFGYYTVLADPRYIYHSDLGFEFLIDAGDAANGVFLYDFASSTFFYTSPTWFPFLYDFTLNSVLYYYPDPTAVAPHIYGTGSDRMFYSFATMEVITK